MSKDPAFLFYGQDFYGGTRIMLPEERACYVDLMIYQHQNEYIPNDLKRVLMFCSGVNEATLIATLEAKFKQCEKGWYNERLKKVIEERENYSKKQSENGIIGAFWKKSNKILNKTEQKKLRAIIPRICSNNADLLNNWKDYLNDPKAMLKAMLKHLEDVNEIEIENVKEIKSEIIYPFDTEKFKSQWRLWKSFKRKEFNFNYKSDISEQAALKKLSEISKGVEDNAIKIINQSINNGWKGLFELKNNEKQSNNNQQGASDDFRRKTAQRLGAIQP